MRPNVKIFDPKIKYNPTNTLPNLHYYSEVAFEADGDFKVNSISDINGCKELDGGSKLIAYWMLRALGKAMAPRKRMTW